MNHEQNMLNPAQLQLAADSPIFQNIPVDELEHLLKGRVLLRSFAKGEIIYSPSHYENSIGLFLEGSGVAEKGSSSVILNSFQPGSFFGVATLFFHPDHYVTTVRAKSSCLVAFLSEKALLEIFELDSRVSLNYIAFLSSRIHFLNRKIDKFTAVSAEEKLVLWLLEQAEFNNPIPMSVSYARLAEILDLGRSSLYRAMDALEAEGILRKEKKLLTILDMEALHHWPEK